MRLSVPLLLCALACNGSEPVPAETIAVAATSCDTVVLPGAGESPRGWQVDGWPLLRVAGVDGGLGFQAPAVARPTTVDIVDTTTTAQRYRVTIQPASVPAGLPDGMAPGCGPFQYGVASGDPAPDGVLLWTRVDPSVTSGVTWELSTDPDFGAILQSGTVTATADTDHTLQVAVDGLNAATTYYYRFRTADGQQSPLGRTRTAGARDHLRVAAMSCSSIYSGFFNAYRRLGERDDLDLVIHVGDYLYDFVDGDEQIRVPSPEPVDPDTLETWRARHAYYLTDPDLRLARQAHPWFVIWDNHDINRSPPTYGGGVQAFREWVPMRQPDPARPEVAYRELDYGPLAQFFMVDDYTFQGTDTLPGGGESNLSNAQYAHLEQALTASSATWRFLPMQKQVTTLDVAGIISDVGGTWQSYPEARSRLFALLERTGSRNNVVLTGHNHWTLMADLVENPTAEPPYDPMTDGTSSYGAELMAASISRGNFDETLGTDDEETYLTLAGGIQNLNPHHIYDELTSHGYGLVDVTADGVTLEMWYSEILAPADEEVFYGGYRLPKDAGQVERTRLDAPTPAEL